MPDDNTNPQAERSKSMSKERTVCKMPFLISSLKPFKRQKIVKRKNYCAVLLCPDYKTYATAATQRERLREQ